MLQNETSRGSRFLLLNFFRWSLRKCLNIYAFEVNTKKEEEKIKNPKIAAIVRSSIRIYVFTCGLISNTFENGYQLGRDMCLQTNTTT
jgi:hypothetical protein